MNNLTITSNFTNIIEQDTFIRDFNLKNSPRLASGSEGKV